MGDITGRERSAPVQIVGGGTSDEENIVNISELKELSSSDILDNGILTDTITVGTTAVELKVGASIKENRKSVFFQLLDGGFLYWGHSASETNFIAFKNQMTSIAAGENTSIWIKANDSGKQVAIGEA